MAMHSGDPLWLTLRAHLLPALKPYRVDNLEIAYSTEGECKIMGTQFRDEGGLRVPRLQIPQSLMEQLEVFCRSLVERVKLCEGEGLLSVSVGKACVVLQHQPYDERAEPSHDEWQF